MASISRVRALLFKELGVHFFPGHLWCQQNSGTRKALVSAKFWRQKSAGVRWGICQKRAVPTVPSTNPVDQPIDLLAIRPAYTQYRLYIGQAYWPTGQLAI
jgi:hypothetical protein